MKLNRVLNVGLIGLCLVIFAGSGRQPAVAVGQVMLPDQGCTVFYGADENVVLGGNNEDFINPLTYVWFIPPQKDRFGMVVFGYDDMVPQGIVNDQGLFYDGLALPYKEFRETGKPNPPGGLLTLIEDVFATSSTVEQAQELLGRYNLNGLQTAQLFFGDRFGHSLIIDGDSLLPKSGKYQVAANFRQAEIAAPPYPSDRFNTASQMLSEAGAYSVDLFRNILNAVHLEGDTPTQYSQVYDLKNGLIYLYHFHNYQDVVVLNIADELAKGPHSSTIASLFPKNTDRENFAFQALLQYQVNAEASANTNFDSNRLTDYVGEYRNPAEPEGAITRITLEAGKLLLQNPGMPAVQLYPKINETFFHPYFVSGTQLMLNFNREFYGPVSGVDVRLLVQSLDVVQPYHLEKILEPAPQFTWLTYAGGGVGLIAVIALFWTWRRLKIKEIRK